METSDEQNSYLSGMISLIPIQRRRSRLPDEEAKYKDSTYCYTVRVLREIEGRETALEIPVCFKAFCSIFGMNKGKVEYIQKSLNATGLCPKDMRGKSSSTHMSLDIETRNAVIQHIKSFKTLARPSHYGIKHSQTLYLPEELNVSKMYDMFKSQEEYKELKVSYDSYRKIFNSNFNISFKYPRVDSCSACDAFKATVSILKTENKQDEIKKLTTENALHTNKAKAFYDRKRKSRKLAQKDQSVLSIAMDFQKNVSLPNISTNDVYYKRQLSMFSFNVHTLSNNNATFYCYPEVNGKQGPEEVASFLFHYLNNFVDTDRVKTVHIFCDSAGGQNKNFTIFRFLHYIVNVMKLFEMITITFPMRGHSYLECDRDMGIINLKSKMELPEEFFNLIRASRRRPTPFEVVQIGNRDIPGWNKLLSRFYVKRCPFKTQPIREIKFCQGTRLAMYRNSYNGHWNSAPIQLPTNKTLRNPFLKEGEFEMPDLAYED